MGMAEHRQAWWFVGILGVFVMSGVMVRGGKLVPWCPWGAGSAGAIPVGGTRSPRSKAATFTLEALMAWGGGGRCVPVPPEATSYVVRIS